VLARWCSCIDCHIRFVGLFGVYLSLQYLSLSDGTVLMFLSPLCTAVAGAFFLGEMFSLSQALAGGEHSVAYDGMTSTNNGGSRELGWSCPHCKASFLVWCWRQYSDPGGR
jgi:hypothetical protein